MQSVIVTGGAGLIGSHLCKRLVDDGFYVTCVDNLLTGLENNIEELKSNPKFQFINHDVTKPLESKTLNHKPSAIFHLASPASPNHHSKISYHSLPEETMLVNTNGTRELLKFAKIHNAKFLFTSSSEVYGDPLEHPQKESYRGNVSTTGPRAVYDEAKRFGETITSYYQQKQGVDARIARIFNTYGPNMQQTDMRMIIVFIEQALNNKPITIFGDGKQTRSLCYVSDTVEGLVRLMFYESTNGAVVNVGSDIEHTILEYAEMVKKITNSTSEIVFSENLPQDDPQKRKPDITLAKDLLSWQPKIGLPDGLGKMIEYFKSQ